MKKYIFILSLFFLQLSLQAQGTATLDLENGRIEAGKYKFDVSITRTSQWNDGAGLAHFLGSSSFRFNFNTNGLGSDPSIEKGSHFNNASYTFSPAILSGQINVEVNLAYAFEGAPLDLNDKQLLFTVAVTIANAGETAGINWVQVSTAAFDGKDENLNSTLNGDLNASPLPVELKSFNATNQKGNSVNLQWETATEINNHGFEVERSLKVQDRETPVWEKISFVEGAGNSNSTKSYSFVDKNPVGGTSFLYRLKQIDIDGTFEYSDLVEVEILPAKYELFQNYPNPFNPTTKIKFSLPEDAKVALDIYNMLGQRVMTLFNKDMKAGFHQVQFDTQTAGHQLASGIYIYTISTKNFSSVKKMVLLK